MKLVMKTLYCYEWRKKNWELTESVRMMNSQRCDVKKISLIEEGNKIGINEVIQRNEITNNSLK